MFFLDEGIISRFRECANLSLNAYVSAYRADFALHRLCSTSDRLSMTDRAPIGGGHGFAPPVVSSESGRASRAVQSRKMEWPDLATIRNFSARAVEIYKRFSRVRGQFR